LDEVNDVDRRNIPLPPFDMTMPRTPQTIFLAANFLVALIALALAERYRRKSGSPYGYLFLLGGALAVFNEPVVDILGLCWFPSIGTLGLLKAWGVTIPLYLLPVYCWYVGGQAFYAFTRFEARITVRGVFKLYGTFALINVLLEVPGLNIGVYTYYGNQPFELFGFPLWWTIGNALMPIVMAAAVFLLRPYLTGWRRLVVIPLGPVAAGLTNGAIFLPIFLGLNSGMPVWINGLAVCVSLVLAFIVAVLVSQTVSVDKLAAHVNPVLNVAESA